MTSAAALVRGNVMASAEGSNTGVQVFGITLADLEKIPGVAQSKQTEGSLADFDKGVAIGSGVARDLGVGVGDQIRLISPDGVKTAFGTSPAGQGLYGGIYLQCRAL